MRKSLTRGERLRSQSDISRVFKSANRVSCSGAKLVYRNNDIEWNRIAVTLVRKYGNSVQRNRSKRIVREIYRSLKNNLKPGFDIVIVLYPGDYDYSIRMSQIKYLLCKANIFM
ncbi:MAG: ribonuclease P protein component [Spirochaetales bacterium]|nr:ribonuclease P protein component [Spirochaetales bacterium]